MLSKEQINEFFTRGYIMIEALFEQSEVGEMSAAIERLKTEADSLDQTCIHKGSMFVITEKDGHKQIRRVSWAAPAEPELKKWKEFLTRIKNPKDTVIIGLVGKYVELKDSYKSIAESLVV